MNRELSPVFEERLRQALADQDRDWLIDQTVRLTLDRHSLEEMARHSERETPVLRLRGSWGVNAEEVIDDGVVVCLSLINNLEVNEQVLYARMIDIEQTTLIT